MNQLVINNFSVKRGSFTLSPISLTIQMGEIFAILGRTGSGKTVLLEAISGMFPGDTGSILLDEPTYGTYLPVRESWALCIRTMACSLI